MTSGVATQGDAKLGTVARLVQLFDATTKITFSEKHDFRLDNAFNVQDEIGCRVVESLQSSFRWLCRSLATVQRRPGSMTNSCLVSESYGSAGNPAGAMNTCREPSKADPNLLAHATLSMYR